MERLDCPACNRSLQHQGDLAGQRLRCPACGKVFEAPPLPEAAEPAPLVLEADNPDARSPDRSAAPAEHPHSPG